jgi:hypothetical protein
MWHIRFASGQFNGRFTRALDDKIYRYAIDMLTAMDEDILRQPENVGIPYLYEAIGETTGELLYYRRKPAPCQPDDDFADITTCLANGWLDCEDAAAWRCAELRVRFGIDAKTRVLRQDFEDGGWLYHFDVEFPVGYVSPITGTRIEDPSAHMDHKKNFALGRVG